MNDTLWTWHRVATGPIRWDTGSALQRTRLRVVVRRDASMRHDWLAANIGGGGAWTATGRLRCMWGVDVARFSWFNASKEFRVPHDLKEVPSRGETLEWEVGDVPPFSMRGFVDGLAFGGERSLDYASAIPFRPYAVLGDAISVGIARLQSVEPWVEPCLAIDSVEAWVGAKPEPIVALGDSQIHAGLVTDALKALGAPGMVISGKAGGDSAGALARMETDVFPFKPRHLLVWVGSNDIGYAEADGRGAEAGIATALANIDEIVGEAQSRGIECHLLGALPRGMPIIREFNRRLSLLAGSRRAGFHDAYDVLHRRNDKMDLRYSDGLHPNADGAALLAKHYAEQGLVDALRG